MKEVTGKMGQKDVGSPINANAGKNMIHANGEIAKINTVNIET